MKPTPWFPIDTPPVRQGRYEVMDRTTGNRRFWLFEGVDGAGNAIWFSEDSLLIMHMQSMMWRGVTDEIWTQGNGEQVPVFMMHEEHVKNVLRLILRKKRERDAQLFRIIATPGSAWERGMLDRYTLR